MTVKLKLKSIEYEGWKSATITRGIEQLSATFSLTLSERWKGKSIKGIRIGDECEISLDGVLVFTGYIDDVQPNYDSRSHEIVITGRSKTCDLVDCSILIAKKFSGAKIEKIASDLAKPFGVKVISEVDTGAPVTEKINVGETPKEALAKIALMRGLLLTDNESGDLVITRTSTKKADTSLVKRGQETNILSGRVVNSQRDRFSLYRCIGQNKGTDEDFGAIAAEPFGEARDNNVSRYRPYIIFAEKAADSAFCKERAVWERSYRAGDSIQLQYEVKGWQHSKGQLWAPNMLVSVEDDLADINGVFLISRVRLSLDEGGQRTSLTLQPPEAFSTEPELPKTAKSSSYWQDIERAGQ